MKVLKIRQTQYPYQVLYYQNLQVLCQLIDITLVNSDNIELDMGTGFDEFSRLSYHGCLDITKEAYKNRLMLLGIMTDAGWDFFRNEWWHYQLYNSKNFPIVNDI